MSISEWVCECADKTCTERIEELRSHRMPAAQGASFRAGSRLYRLRLEDAVRAGALDGRGKPPGRRARPDVPLSPIRTGGSMPIGPDYDERTGENEALFREVNERLKERKRDDLAWQAPSEWICECAEETCTERIVMSPLEYEQLRSEPTHFAVVPNEKHVSLDVERIVEKRDRYWVVEKVGEAAEIAEETDPR